MLIYNCNLHLNLPYVESLKGRRAIVNSIKDKLKKFNISLLDISGEYVKEADIAFVFLSPNAKNGSQILSTIENFLERNFSEIEWEIDYEVI